MILNKKLIAILLIFSIGLIVRLYGINWDQNHHLHPDERFLTMLETTIRLPDSFIQYLSTSTSPLNPYNYPDYQFYVYGTFPLFLTKIVGHILNLSGYDQIYLVGRSLSALFDSFNIILLYILALKIFNKQSKFVIIPSLLYAFCVLPLQLSHFFAVDTFLTFFLLSTFTLLVYKKYYLAPISFGMAMACKISAIYFSPIYALFILYYLVKHKKVLNFFLYSLFSLIITFLSFRFFQPYAFTGLFKINSQFINNLKTLESYNTPSGWFPPSVQWISKIPLIHASTNIIFWGIGLPLIILLILAALKTRLNIIKTIPSPIYFSFAWIILLFFYQGIQFSTTIRYFIVIYPFIILLISYIIYSSSLNFKITKIFIIFHFLFAVAFLSIYSLPHSRVQASRWIYQNISPGSSLTNEYWDDPLPLYLPAHNPNIYQNTMLPLYDQDSKEKWDKINPIIDKTNYIIMSSNRLWASIPQVPEIYPYTSYYYHHLFDEKLNFTKVADFNSYPGFILPFLKKCYYFGPTNYPYRNKINTWVTVDDMCNYPGIYLRDDTADESFTVYDHPKVLIYQKTR